MTKFVVPRERVVRAKGLFDSIFDFWATRVVEDVLAGIGFSFCARSFVNILRDSCEDVNL